MGLESFAFHLLAGLAVASALFGVVLVRDVRAGALWLLVSLLSLAGIYVLLDEALVAVLSIGIHASVTAALLLFAYMLVDPGVDELGPPVPARSALKAVGAVLASAIGLIVVIGMTINPNVFWGLFEGFHSLFFEGDSWLFLYSDTLIRLFPLRFWQDAFLIAAIIALGGGFALGLGLRTK